MSFFLKGAGFLFGATINGVWNLTKLITYSTIGIVGLALISKPEKKSFDDFFDDFIKQYTQGKYTDSFLDNTINSITGSSASTIVKFVSKKEIKDYILCQFATVTFTSEAKMYFVGTGKGWHNVETFRRLFKGTTSNS